MVLLNRRLLSLAGEVRWYVAWCTLLSVAITTTRVAQVLLLAHAVVAAIDGRGPVAEFAWLAVAVAARAVLLGFAEVAAYKTAGVTKERLRTRLYERLLQLGPGYVMRSRSGEVRATLVDGVEAMESYYGRYLPALGNMLIGPLAIWVILLAIEPWLALIAFGGCVLAVAGAMVWLAAFAASSDRVWTAIGETDAEFVDTVQGLPTLKAFNATGRRGAFIAERAERLRTVAMDQLRYSLMHIGVQRLSTLGAAAAATVHAVVAYPDISGFALVSTVLLIPETFRPLDDLGRYAHDAMAGVSAAKGIDDFLAVQPAAPAPVAPVEGAEPMLPSVTLDDVTFRYPGRKRAAVESVSFSVRPGEQVAVVGESGSGKSTLAALLLRFMDPESGRILLGGRDLRQLPDRELRGSFGFVAQDTYLFHGSVEDNITFGRADATRQDVEAAAVAAGLDGLALDDTVGERGLQLSGGQRQRIAIARAVLKDAPVLILDEATSSVDAATEAAIQGNLRSAAEGRTTLVIAHRLSTVRDADRIVVLDNGRVAEIGTHEELEARGGVYARLIAAQNELTGTPR